LLERVNGEATESSKLTIKLITLGRGASARLRLSKWSLRCLSEVVGTFALVFCGPASVVVVSYVGVPFPLRLVAVAAVFGLTVAMVIVVLGKVSGANINPSITVASLLAGTLEGGMVVPYIASQLFGGLLAGLALKGVFDSLAPSAYLGSTKLATGISPIEGVVLEALGTLGLATAALSASKYMGHHVHQAVLVGGTLFLLILLIGPPTGGSFNPARSLGPSLFSGYFESQWVYYVGPLLGGACAGLIFRRWL